MTKKITSLLVLFLMLTACGPDSPVIQDPDTDDTEQSPVNPGPEDPEPETPEPGPEAPEGQPAFYTEVAESLSDWSGDYLITYSTSSSILVFDSWNGDTAGGSENDIHASLTADGIPAEDGDPYKAVVTKSGSAYTVYVTGIGYIGLESSKNALNKAFGIPSGSEDNYLWTFSYKDGGSVWMRNVAHDGRRLQWNASSEMFR